MNNLFVPVYNLNDREYFPQFNLRKTNLLRLIASLMLILFLLSMVAWPNASASGQEYISGSLGYCQEGGFSTEEDFMMEGEPDNGDPYISDGDLLSFNGQVCARNADLLAAFNSPTGAILPDLGLDAVDIIDVDNRLIIFSTELDDPLGRFTAGDLLSTSGLIIPNSALVNPFDIKHDIGLDAVHLVGLHDQILAFINRTIELDPDVWLEQGRLQEELATFGIDIWFSIEGTHRLSPTDFILDGDLLSATGIIVMTNRDLLPPPVPAGIPNDGVDFGLDAATAARSPNAVNVHYSTEILYNGQPSLTDGDVLQQGAGVVATNQALVMPFQPAADFLGLDALFISLGGERDPDPEIQMMCGNRSVVDFNGGVVTPGDPGTGLYRENPSPSWPDGQPRRPCGEFVPIDGFLPSSDVKEFRVAYRDAGDPVGTVDGGIQTHWHLWEWRPIPIPGCYKDAASPWLNTDADGWLDANDYITAKNGTMTGCANSGMRLAVWDTNNRQGLGPANKDGHYVLWLEWKDNSAVTHLETYEHHLQLDNTLPEIAPYPDGLQLRLMDGTTIVPTCGEAQSGISQFQVWGQFSDDYYWSYSLILKGGIPPAVHYGPHSYYDPDDGTPLIKNTDDTGTMPNSTTVHLRNIDMAVDLGDRFVDCCYLLELHVRDAAIRHSFDNSIAVDNSGSSAWQAQTFITFAASPSP